jgi:hypothetical protein
MGAQQKYLFHYSYLEKSSYNAIENNNLYNDERGEAEILQNYNHNSLFLNFKAGEHTARALSVLLASDEVGLVLDVANNVNFIEQTFDVYDLVKIGNIGLSPTVHFYEISGEFLSKQINNVNFLTRHVVFVGQGDAGAVGIDQNFVRINTAANTYQINANVLTNGIVSFYYPTGKAEAPIEFIDLRDLNEFSITFSGDSIPANFLKDFVNENCTMRIENAVSIMKIGDNAFNGSRFANIEADFNGIRELGSGVQFAKTGGTITTQNPLGLVPYDGLRIVLTNDVQEIDNLIIASDFFASGSKKLLNDTCNALSHFKGDLSEIKNCTIVEDFAALTNLNKSKVIFDNCTFAVDQNFGYNLETRKIIIRNCNQQNTGSQVFKFTGFQGSIIIENSFKSAEAIYVVDDTAAYSLEIDDHSFINAGENSGSLNKVLPNQNRRLPELVAPGGFLRINGENIVNFSGNSYLTTNGEILIFPEIQTVEFSNYKQWNLKNGNFAFTQWNLPTKYLYNPSDFKSYIKGFTNGSFFKMKMNQIADFFILASQLLEILKCENCFTTYLTSASDFELYIHNDLPPDFNYFEIVRNESSLKFENRTRIAITNDPDNLLRNALQAAYPEYFY